MITRQTKSLFPKVIVLGILLWGSAAWSRTMLWDAAEDFSLAGNPNGQWRYGWAAAIAPGYTFTLYNGTAVSSSIGVAGLELHRWNGSDPSVSRNPFGVDVASLTGAVWPLHTCGFHPGQNGQYSIFRWTAPRNGVYKIAATFWVGHQGQCTTDVHVVKNGSTAAGVELFDGDINAPVQGNSDNERYHASLLLNSGDTIDFAVGRGSDGYEADTTILSATILEEEACPIQLESDFNQDCYVDMDDFTLFALEWLGVNLEDYAPLARSWQECTDPVNPVCQKTIERVMADEWIEKHITGPSPQPPFTFVYDGVQSYRFLSTWNFQRTRETVNEKKTKWTLRYSHPSGGLVVTCEAIVFNEYPAVDWVLWFENTGTSNTRTIRDVRVVDMNMNYPVVPAGGSTVTEQWDAATDWNSDPVNPNGTWRYQNGWIPSYTNLNIYDKTSYPGLQRWSLSGGIPWIGKNTSADAVNVDGTSVPIGKLVMINDLGYEGKCPGLAWTCPESGFYTLSGSLHNIGAGGNGVDWNLNLGTTVLDSGSIGNQGSDTFNLENLLVGGGEKYVLTFNSRGDVTGDLTEVEFTAIRTTLGTSEDDFLLHHSKGSSAVESDFQPMETGLSPDMNLVIAPYQGRSSDGSLPFFNIEQPGGTGRILAIGWTGQWQAAFRRTTGNLLNVQAGLELMRVRLYPGEKIRVPSMLLMFWSGNYRDSQNQFRHLMLDHYTPGEVGITFNGPVAASVHGTYGFEATTAANMISFINTTYSHSYPVQYIWIDAGWYDLNGTTSWVNVGTWEPDPVRYPSGMKPVADTAHNRGYKFLLWFEPERVTEGSWLDVNHPDWIFKNGGGWWLLNLGHPDALAWVKTKFSNMIEDIGIDCYRQDFNVFPLAKWRYGETTTRQGMNEIKHIMGLYEYLDYLLEQHPNLVIDNCASGGRRIDMEMMKRSVPLWRSDLCWVATPEQSMEYGLSNWISLHGVGSVSLNKYDFRSGMGTTFSSAFNHNDSSIWTTAIQLMNQYNEVRWMYKGDFYPLTPYSLSENDWMAWQFHRDDVNQGLVQAFRRSSSTTTAMTFKLQGLTPTATYSLKNYDSTTTTALGSTLMNNGLYIPISSKPGSVLIRYWKN